MTEREAYWSGHLAAIEREGITTRAYAAREGLSVGALYQWRRELKSRVLSAVSPPPPSGGFVAVTVPTVSGATRDAVACRLRLGAGVTLELTSVPSAAWLASVVEALG
jgi:transposase-like protein